MNATSNDLGRIAGSVARQLNAGASRVDVDGAQRNSGHPVRAVLHVTTTVGLAIAVAVMAVKLSEQRDLRRQAETQVREIAVARAANIGAEQQQAARVLRAALAARMESGSATSNVAALTAPGTAPGLRDRDFQQQLRKQLADPALRSAFRAQQRAAVLQLYGDLLRSWHLPADKSDRLLDLLAEQQLQEMEQSLNTSEPGSAAVARASDDAAMSASKDEINALLTDQQRKELQYQQDSLNERLTVGSLADELSLAQMPLTDSQREQMTHAMVDERNAVSRPDVSNMPGNSPDAQRTLEDWQSALDQRIQDRAAAILTSAQQSRYEQFMTRQREARTAFASFEVPQAGDYNAASTAPPATSSP